MKPPPSVLWPTNMPSSATTQFTAPRASASGVQQSTAAATAALWGMVTDRPPNPRVRMACRALVAPPSGTSKAK